jgi:hypothetical protein
MQLRWTAEAATDLESIADYVLEHAPKSGARGDPSRLRSTDHATHVSEPGPAEKREGKRKLVLAHCGTLSCTRSRRRRVRGAHPARRAAVVVAVSLRPGILRECSGASRVRFAAPNGRFRRALDPPSALSDRWQLPERPAVSHGDTRPIVSTTTKAFLRTTGALAWLNFSRRHLRIPSMDPRNSFNELRRNDGRFWFRISRVIRCEQRADIGQELRILAAAPKLVVSVVAQRGCPESSARQATGLPS